MLPTYVLTVDITANDTTICEETFRLQVSESLSHLDGLKGSFDRSPSTIKYYPPNEQYGMSLWSARGLVMISLGKARAEFLIKLYQSISRLIMLELPDLEVRAEINKVE